jgi:hypothetical protein
MSDDEEPPDGTASSGQPPDTKPSQDRPRGKKDGPEQESEEPSLLDSIAEQKKDRRRRSDNLRGLFGVQAARDVIGEASYRVSGGGNLNYYDGVTFNVFDAARADVVHLQRETTKALLERFAPPASQQRLTEVVGRESVVFLRGAEGTGRMTAALAALIDWVASTCPGSERNGEERVGIIRIRGAAGRASLPELRRGHGYLLAGSYDDWIREIDQLADLVVKNESRLVVLVPRGRMSLPGAAVDHLPPPAIDVFHRWFEYEATMAEVEPELAPEVEKEITQDLDGERSPQRAVSQACEVIQAIKEGLSSEALLAELPRRLGDHIRGRLDEGQPIVGRCFMAAVAVLHGDPEFTVSRAALTFADLIYEAWHIEVDKRPPPTWEQLDTWLEYAGATAHRPGRAGSGRIVRLNRTNAPAVTISVLWEDHPTIREPLMNWLRWLGDDGTPTVQLKAAHAVGKLATLDFATIRKGFLAPWTESGRFADHRLAALALEAAAQDPRMVSRVHDHLRRLASSNRYGARAVAIQAYGSSIGVNAIGEALQALRRISTRPTIRLNQDAARSIAYLYEEATAPAIVRELASWVEAGSLGGRHTAALAFIRLAVPEPGAANRPPLAELAAQDDLASLWLNALMLRIITSDAERSRPAAPAAWGVLGEWVSRYDQQHAVRVVVDQVLPLADAQAARLYLRLWRLRKLISSELYGHFTRLVEKGSSK